MPRRSLSVWLAALLGAILPSNAWAQVYDEAKFFSREAALEADKQLRQLGQQHQLTLVVETFAQPPAHIADLVKDRERRAAAFHQWAEQRRATHHAHLYILICRQPGRVEISIHETLSRRFPKEKLDALRDTLLKHLREKHYDVALRESVGLIKQTLSETAAQEKSPAGALASPGDNAGAGAERSAEAGHKSAWSWVFWAILLGVGLIVLLAILRGLMYAFSGPPSPGPSGGGAGMAGPTAGGFGGSWLGSFLAGMFGAAVGSWLYDRFFRGGTPAYGHEAHPVDAHGSPPGTAPPVLGDDPTARYAPDGGEVITTGGDFDATDTGGDFDASAAEYGTDVASDADDLTGPDVESGFGDVGGDFGTGDVGGDFDMGGGDFGGGDFGGDF